MKKIFNITEKEIIEIIKIAFEDGENWGVTYSTWFIPTESRTNKEKEKTINKIIEAIKEKEIYKKSNI